MNEIVFPNGISLVHAFPPIPEIGHGNDAGSFHVTDTRRRRVLLRLHSGVLNEFLPVEPTCLIKICILYAETLQLAMY